MREKIYRMGDNDDDSESDMDNQDFIDANADGVIDRLKTINPRINLQHVFRIAPSLMKCGQRESNASLRDIETIFVPFIHLQGYKSSNVANRQLWMNYNQHTKRKVS